MCRSFFKSLVLATGLLAGLVVTGSPVSASTSWHNYFAKCTPILVAQWNPINSRLHSATSPARWNKSAVLEDMRLFLALAGREAGCGTSPDSKLDADVNSLSTDVAAAMIVGQEWLQGEVSEVSFIKGLEDMYAVNRKVAFRFAYDDGRYELG